MVDEPSLESFGDLQLAHIAVDCGQRVVALSRKANFSGGLLAYYEVND